MPQGILTEVFEYSLTILDVRDGRSHTLQLFIQLSSLLSHLLSIFYVLETFLSILNTLTHSIFTINM